MKRTLIYSFLILLGAACQEHELEMAPKDDFSVVPGNPEYFKGQMYVKFSGLDADLDFKLTRSGEMETSDEELNAAAGRIGMSGMKRVFPYAGRFEARTRAAGLHLWYKVDFDRDMSVDEARKIMKKVSAVSSAEGIVKPESESMNDPFFNRQWYLSNDGSNGMTAGADISIQEAWEIEKGRPEVIVAVSDANFNPSHEDLRHNLWLNPGEVNQKEWWMDNDGNGYGGDWFGILDAGGRVMGMNPFENPYASDHGTHIAGIIAAKNNNGTGICGIAGGVTGDDGVRVMNVPMSAEGIKYAADNGAVIINCSWGTKANREILQDAVNYFVQYAGVDEKGVQTGPMKGGVVIASAGNEDRDFKEHYPSNLDNVIAVAGMAPDFRKTNTSNFSDWVDVTAPAGGDGEGWQIVSCKSSGYGEMKGTSQAAAITSGVAALIVSHFGGEGMVPYDLEYRLLRGVTPIGEYNPGYEGKLGTGCVNALKALQISEVNYRPSIVHAHDFSGQFIMDYGQKQVFEFTVDDKEDGTDLECTVEDASGAVALTKDGGKLVLTVNNVDCKAGDHVIRLTVTDKGGVSNAVNISVKLHPEYLKEPVIQSVMTDELLIRAAMTFSGKIKVEFYDANGRLVFRTETVASLSEPGKVDCTGLSAGNYTLKLYCNNKTIKKNIIKL